MRNMTSGYLFTLSFIDSLLSLKKSKLLKQLDCEHDDLNAGTDTDQDQGNGAGSVTIDEEYAAFQVNIFQIFLFLFTCSGFTCNILFKGIVYIFFYKII